MRFSEELVSLVQNHEIHHGKMCRFWFKINLMIVCFGMIQKTFHKCKQGMYLRKKLRFVENSVSLGFWSKVNKICHDFRFGGGGDFFR